MMVGEIEIFSTWIGFWYTAAVVHVDKWLFEKRQRKRKGFSPDFPSFQC